MKDVAIIGGGPGGMNAAIYAARSGLSVTIFEEGLFGGQMNNTDMIDNYIGFDSIPGDELSETMEEHMNSNLSETDIINTRAESIKKVDGVFHIEYDYGVLKAKKVIIATGAKHRKLGIHGENLYTGRGITNCAVCDGNFFERQPVAVIGGGNSAVEDALYLSNLASKVYLIHRRDEFRADFIEVEKLKKKDNIEYKMSCTPETFNGEDGDLTDILVYNKHTTQLETIKVNGAFVQIGLLPQLPSIQEDNEPEGFYDNDLFINVDSNMESKIEGLYAIGDVQSKKLRQVVTAVADGAIAAKDIQEKLM